MSRKDWGVYAAGLSVVIGLIGFGVGVSAAPVTGPKATTAQDSQELSKKMAALDKKLDDVLKQEQAILQQLDTMMEELRIIKIRATR